jgi:hypothetical protein
MSSMGTDMADINNDGYPDLFTTDMLPGDDYRLKTLGSFDNINLFNAKLRAGFYYQYVKNCLQLNNRNGKFLEIANYSGVSATDWSWGALMFDLDNDGYNDIFVCNGVNRMSPTWTSLTSSPITSYQKMALSGKKEKHRHPAAKNPRTPMLQQSLPQPGQPPFPGRSAKNGASPSPPSPMAQPTVTSTTTATSTSSSIMRTAPPSSIEQ